MVDRDQCNTASPEGQEDGAGCPEEGIWIINPRNWSGMAGTFLERDFPGPLIRHHDTFYQWVGTHYAAVSEADIRQIVYRFLGSAYTMIKEAGEDGETVTVRRRFYADDRAVNKFIDALRSLVHVSETFKAPTWLPAATAEQRKHDPRYLMAFQNGLLDLKTEELLPHSPAFLSMNAVEYAYDPKTKAPAWDKFVREVLPDEDARDTLQQEMGYLISNDTRHQKIFAHIGERRSGKGTIAYVLKLLIGPENIVNPTLENLKQHFGLASLIDKRAAIIGDARLTGGDTSELVSRLLSLSGEDDITVPRKNRDDWYGKLNVRVLINSNMMPGFTDGSGVIADRFIVIRFLESFYGREDLTLRDRLAQELPGILNWALEGLRALRKQGRFNQPVASAELMEMMRFAASPILKFINDCLEVGKELQDNRDAVYARYKRWCEENEHRPMSKTKFDVQLNAAQPSVTVARPGVRGEDRDRVYRGIRRAGAATAGSVGGQVITLAGRVAAAAPAR